MKNLLIALASIISITTVVLAVDPGHFVFAHVDAGGHPLRMLISGQGSPAVVFETGGTPASGGPLEGWERIQPAVSKFTTTVSYDRAGSGWSPPGPKPRDARQVAIEIHTALRNAGVPPPYILVGHSFGGPMNRVFAGMYPGDVAGLVLVDPTQEEFIAWNQTNHPTDAEKHDDEWKNVMASLEQARDSKVPVGIPVILITGMGPRTLPSFATEEQKRSYRSNHHMWLKFHQAWLDKIPESRHIVTENTGHNIPVEEPELVIKATRDAVDQARSSRQPPTTLAPR